MTSRKQNPDNKQLAQMRKMLNEAHPPQPEIEDDGEQEFSTTIPLPENPKFRPLPDSEEDDEFESYASEGSGFADSANSEPNEEAEDAIGLQPSLGAKPVPDSGGSPDQSGKQAHSGNGDPSEPSAGVPTPILNSLQHNPTLVAEYQLGLMTRQTNAFEVIASELLKAKLDSKLPELIHALVLNTESQVKVMQQLSGMPFNA